MRVEQIKDLPMATSSELYRLSWVIEQLMDDPRRIVQAPMATQSAPLVATQTAPPGHRYLRR
jgi:hypothetical protein